MIAGNLGAERRPTLPAAFRQAGLKGPETMNGYAVIIEGERNPFVKLPTAS